MDTWLTWSAAISAGYVCSFVHAHLSVRRVRVCRPLVLRSIRARVYLMTREKCVCCCLLWLFPCLISIYIYFFPYWLGFDRCAQQAYNATAVIRQMRHLVLASSSSRSSLGEDNTPSPDRQLQDSRLSTTNGR